MERRRDRELAVFEMTAYILGFGLTVPLIMGMTVAGTARVLGLWPAMVAAPFVLWAVAGIYWRAFEGAKDGVLYLRRARVTSSARRQASPRVHYRRRSAYQRSL